MNKSGWIFVAHAIFLLFLIQLIGSLVESIYILNLLNTSLNENALGLLFFFSPALLLLFRKRLPPAVLWGLFLLLILSRGALPYIGTSGRLLAAGVGAGCALLLFPYLLTARIKGSSGYYTGLWLPAGAALATALSVLLRTVNAGLDYTLFPEGGWLGLAMAAVLAYAVTRFHWQKPVKKSNKSRTVLPPVVGIFMVLTLILFAFSAPSVIARWTEGSYRWITAAVSLLSLVSAGLIITRPGLIDKITPAWLLVWNLLFTLSLTGTILVHQVAFPQTSGSAAVVVGAPMWLQQVPLLLMLLLFPVIFLDLRLFSGRIQRESPAPRDLAPGMLAAGFSLVILIFFQIFSNTWGYIPPVSPWFRGKFWLPFLLISGLLTLLAWRKGTHTVPYRQNPGALLPPVWSIIIGLVFLVTVGTAVITTQPGSHDPGGESLLVMTYNIQGANDSTGERSYQRQLALIRDISPDIVVLQESDTARISFNNNDYVRYYASKLGYHSYYGPKPVSGTFGTAILSKFPLQNPRSIFSYSDQDEIGTAAAEIQAGGRSFTIYNVHPDGSDSAMLVFAQTLLDQASDKANVITLGDYNLQPDEPAYQLISDRYTNAWDSVYPAGIGADGTDMTDRKRIDHIFFSPSLQALNPIYVLPPESATDHPVHWAEIVWE